MKKIELKDFLQYKYLSNLEYSPSGKAAAFVVSYANEDENKYEGNIWVYENGEVRQLTALGKERSFFWEDDSHILFAACRSEAEQKKMKEESEEFTSIYRICIHGGEATPAFTLPYGASEFKRVNEDTWLVKGKIQVKYADYYKMNEEERKAAAKEKKEEKDYEVIDESPFWFNGAGFINGTRTAMYLYNTKTGESKRITEPQFNTGDALVHEDSIYFIGSSFQCKRPRENQIYRYDMKTEKTSCIWDSEEINPRGVDWFHNKLLVIASGHDRTGMNQNPEFFYYNEEKGGLDAVLTPDYAIGSSVGSDSRLGGGRSTKEADSFYYISTRRNSSGIYALTTMGKEKTIYAKEGSVDCFDIKEDGSGLLFIGMAAQKLQELYALDDKGEPVQLTHFNEEILKDKYVAVPEKLTVMSEGKDIDGWVLKPIDYDETKKYPAIFDIHGGPKTVYGEVFYHEMQLWANEGYFVFFCNPTGSDGRGDEFADIRGKYGTIDYKNLMDFTDAVLEKYPQIDETRVGETGGSYGGFMTNWIVGHTNRFACAATQRSISNWVSFYGISDIGPHFSMDQTAGDIGENIEKMWEQSPLKYVDNVKTPLLFIHSDEDYRCPMSQGMQFYTALAQRDQTVRMCLFHGETHELSRSGKPKHRVRRLSEITDWMNKYLK